jgi:hypothetical protein
LGLSKVSFFLAFDADFFDSETRGIGLKPRESCAWARRRAQQSGGEPWTVLYDDIAIRYKRERKNTATFISETTLYKVFLIGMSKHKQGNISSYGSNQNDKLSDIYSFLRKYMQNLHGWDDVLDRFSNVPELKLVVEAPALDHPRGVDRAGVGVGAAELDDGGERGHNLGGARGAGFRLVVRELEKNS